jgi:hypothetical protein
MVKNYFLDNFVQEMGMNMQKIDISENDEQSLTDSEESDESVYKQKSKVVLQLDNRAMYVILKGNVYL